MTLRSTTTGRAKLNRRENSTTQRLDASGTTPIFGGVRRFPALVLALSALLGVVPSLRSEDVATGSPRVPPTRPAPRPAGPVLAEPLPNPPAESAAAVRPT